MPKIKHLIEAIRDNEHLEKLSLANMGLYDMDLQVCDCAVTAESDCLFTAVD